MAFRVFFIDESDQIHKIPGAKFDKFNQSRNEVSFPEFRDQRIRVAIFYGQSEGRRFAEIDDVSYTVLQINQNGQIDRSDRLHGMRLVAESVGSFFLGEAEPHPERALFAKRTVANRHRWTPTPEMEERLMRLLFLEPKNPTPPKATKPPMTLRLV